MSQIEITPDALQSMIAHAARAAPREACGLLLGCDQRIARAVPTPNIHPTPATRFEIDPQALIDAHRAERSGGPLLLGYYHSHPAGAPVPSALDAAMAAGDGRVWAIVGREGDDWALRLWQDGEAGFGALSYCVIQG